MSFDCLRCRNESGLSSEELSGAGNAEFLAERVLMDGIAISQEIVLDRIDRIYRISTKIVSCQSCESCLNICCGLRNATLCSSQCRPTSFRFNYRAHCPARLLNRRSSVSSCTEPYNYISQYNLFPRQPHHNQTRLIKHNKWQRDHDLRKHRWVGSDPCGDDQ